MSQNKSVEEVVKQLLLRTYDRCFVRGRVPPEVGSSIAHYDMFLKEELNTLIQQERQTSQEREREIVELEKDRAIVVMSEFIKEKGEDYPLGQYLTLLCALKQTGITNPKD